MSGKAANNSSDNKMSKSQGKSQRSNARISKNEYASLVTKKSQEPKWSVEVQTFKAPRVISDSELQSAKRLFWELDRDGSGSIEADEISYMLRSLGQNPTKEGVDALIKLYDDGEKDGKIQLREFLMMYANGLDNQNTSKYEDVLDAFRALEANPEDEKARVSKEQFANFMKDNYELDCDLDEMFGVPGETELKLKDFENFLGVHKSATPGF